MPEDKAAGTFEECHLVNASVLVKFSDGSTTVREAKKPWTYARCLNCGATLWIPKGGGYSLVDVCKRKAPAANEAAD